jgi:hypothetical protein
MGSRDGIEAKHDAFASILINGSKTTTAPNGVQLDAASR